MARLSPFLPFAEDETPLSWAARLAAFHTGGRLVPFLNDLGIDLMALRGGADDAITRLCEIVGQDPEPVRRNSITRLGNRRFGLRGEEFYADITVGKATRFCPACLAEDEASDLPPHAARRLRLAWMLAPVRTCPRHGLALVERKAGAWDDVTHELQALVPETGAALASLAKSRPPRAPSELQSYVLARLEGDAGPAWLDRQGIDQVARATEMLGLVCAYGPRRKPADMTPDDREAAIAVAWPHMRDGEEGVCAAFQDLLDNAIARGTALSSRRAVFGGLYLWLSSSNLRNDPGPIRDLLRAFIIENMDLMPGQNLLGEVILQPRKSSIASIAKTELVDTRTLRNLLVSKGLIKPEMKDVPACSIVLDHDVAVRVAKEIKDAVPVSALPDYLRASRPIVSCLVSMRILVPLSEADARAVGRLGKAVHLHDVEALMARLARIGPEVEVAPPGMLTLAKCAERIHKELRFILPDLLDGYLRRVVRLAGTRGFEGILVDPEEVKAAAGNLNWPGMLEAGPSETDLPKDTAISAYRNRYRGITSAL
ncbi:TniQ family protein [Rhodovulum adriaticum]|uniref:TniQ protein n=1 Tax=Rhodovulum adriaticum TaxID=35804 RepID=A0A4R2NLH6_RHOAD|nr:TniQ family protein [Rhodovulum adriaticum]MBK1636495.1 hypothetical protein [Rhodovulum adriaticum]TCP22198.1 TniQ protein [Rhodovulum adriaticum]